MNWRDVEKLMGFAKASQTASLSAPTYKSCCNVLEHISSTVAQLFLGSSLNTLVFTLGGNKNFLSVKPWLTWRTNGNMKYISAEHHHLDSLFTFWTLFIYIYLWMKSSFLLLKYSTDSWYIMLEKQRGILTCSHNRNPTFVYFFPQPSPLFSDVKQFGALASKRWCDSQQCSWKPL